MIVTMSFDRIVIRRRQVKKWRLEDVRNGQMSFLYKDYCHSNQQQTMSLSEEEFLRRFLLHVLPHGFHRIRYYGFLGNRFRQEKLARCRQLFGMALLQVPPEQSADSGLP
jgi:hypothetical protein